MSAQPTLIVLSSREATEAVSGSVRFQFTRLIVDKTEVGSTHVGGGSHVHFLMCDGKLVMVNVAGSTYVPSSKGPARGVCGWRPHLHERGQHVNTDIAFALAIELMDEHGLIEDGWSFKFDNARKRFGQCDYMKRQISLSRCLTELNDEHHVHDTILHEIAHAILWVEQRKRGHNAAFYAVCRRVGAEPTRCYSGDVATPNHKWEGTCPSCGRVWKRHRLKRSTRNGACPYCVREAGAFTRPEAYRIQWRDVSNATVGV